MIRLSDISNWQDAINQVVCGDCLDLMRMMPDKCVDLVLTDPPYGIKRDKGFEGCRGFRGLGTPIAHKQYDGEWDESRPEKIYFDEIRRISKIALIFGGNFFADLLPQGKHWIVWDKQNTIPTFGDCELIWTNVNRNSVKKYVVEWNGLLGKEKFREHPTQKPLKLISLILADYSKEDILVSDGFAGSFTTAVAAKELGRRFIGCELSEKYCEIGEKRLQQKVLDFNQKAIND